MMTPLWAQPYSLLSTIHIHKDGCQSFQQSDCSYINKNTERIKLCCSCETHDRGYPTSTKRSSKMAVGSPSNCVRWVQGHGLRIGICYHKFVFHRSFILFLSTGGNCCLASDQGRILGGRNSINFAEQSSQTMYFIVHPSLRLFTCPETTTELATEAFIV